MSFERSGEMMSESSLNEKGSNPISGLISSFNAKAADETSILGKAKSLVITQYNQVVPIRDFLRKPSPPGTVAEATKRILHNVALRQNKF
eukprot:m.77800 g.77800  ORF g.77800 m.77800 type:complete len:90 (-) comp8555_c0_seq3:1578-1847(-)